MRYYQSYLQTFKINAWDLLAFIIIFGIIAFMGLEAMGMARPYQIGEVLNISLDPRYLPHYAIRSTLRIVMAMFLSLLATLMIGTLAAKSERAERIIIPMIDILQSLPVLSFMSIALLGFIKLFPNSLLGPECASVFVIFTSQAWNMILGFYQSIRTAPSQLKEVARLYRLSAWKIFWLIEVPYATSPLLWNMMVSMSASWFFVVASEAIEISDQTILLPGIGSYIAIAIQQENIHAVYYAIFSMLIVIFIYDQLIFRPLLHWADKFKTEKQDDDKLYHSWFVRLLERTHFLKMLASLFNTGIKKLMNIPILFSRSQEANENDLDENNKHSKAISPFLFEMGLLFFFGGLLFYTISYLYPYISLQEVYRVTYLGLFTSIRVFILLVLSSMLWVPIGVWIGLRPKLSQIMQPIIQFLAAFPANLFFPFVVAMIIHYQLNVEIWTTPLMILGSQWYILFNVVAGTQAIPKELRYAMRSLHVQRILWWRKFALPAIFPYYITGAISAAGGAWNASIVAEWVNWGSSNLQATGLGAYITQYALMSDFPRIVLGTMCMCFYVLLYNRLIWQPLYHLAESRYLIE